MPWNKIGPYPGAFYKDHWACFSCRKMARKPSPFDVRPEGLRPPASGLLCAECKSSICNMGKAFRPPRQSAVKQWRKVEDDYRRGERYASGRW